MKTQKQKNKLTENAKIARKYRVTERTVRNWRKEKAPISDPSKLSIWLASRKQCPKVSSDVTAATTAAPMGEPQETGAPAALHRIEIAEEEAYRRFESAIPTGDAVAIRNARESWLKLCHSLRLYEAAVDDSKRDRGLLVDKAEVMEALGQLAGLQRMSANHAAFSLCPQLIGETDQIRLRNIIRKTGYDVALLTYAVAGFNVPAWMLEPFKAHYVTNITISRPEIDTLFAEVGEAVQKIVNKVVAAEPPAPVEKHYEPKPTVTP